MRVRRAAAGLLLLTALAGCGGTEERVAAALPVVAAPTELPEGDPGPGAPEAPEPSAEAEEAGHGHEGEALAVVPADAMLDPQTVAETAGGSWSAAPGTSLLTGGCLAATTGEHAGGSRTQVLEDGAGRRLVETVTSYPHGDDAEAVNALGAALPDCGWEIAVAPRLGEAAVAATRTGPDGTVHLTAVSAEGALVVLTAQGGLADDPDLWESLADASLGTACSGAPEGCH